MACRVIDAYDAASFVFKIWPASDPGEQIVNKKGTQHVSALPVADVACPDE